MLRKKHIILSLFAVISLLSFIYFAMASWYLTSAKTKDAQLIENHAIIIAHDLWSLNTYGMQAYLDLVAAADHYKNIEVLTDDQETFLMISGPEPKSLDAFFLRTGLISTKKISHPVLYENRKIGYFKGEQYVRYIYPLFYIFLGLFFTVLTLFLIFYLIFHRRLLAHQVRERTQKYHDLVSLLPEMVLETDAEGNITFANEKAQKCLGITDLTNSKHDCRDYIRLENGKRGDASIYLDSDSADLNRKEYRAKNSSGALFPVLVRSAAIYKNSHFIGARMVIIDITERQALQEQLSRDQKMKSIGIMAGGVAHDLNNILSGIINYPELLLHQLPKDSPLVNLVEPIKDAGLRAAAVVADLLTVARGVAATRESANLNEIIRDYTFSPEFQTIQSLYPKIHFTKTLSPEIDNISCSIIHVRKSLMNLVNNAFEAVHGEGHVLIETANVTVNSPVTTGHGIISPGSYTTVAIKDSGKGIPASELSHILEPFFSKKELGRSGTGLGLTVVWNTMQDHDGGIQVSSNSKGTVFELYFPSSPSLIHKKAVKPNPDIFKGKGQSILIVDDEFQQRDIATRLLTSFGYNVESVASGEAAVEYIKKRPVDLILLDMILESGINGLETYKRIISIAPQQKAIILSGFSESDDVKNTIRLGASGLVNKPYTSEQLASAVYTEITTP
ncbi:hybrid sensor histidine kinase/response regulator [Desulforhopalus sp. 52FAK]